MNFTGLIKLRFNKYFNMKEVDPRKTNPTPKMNKICMVLNALNCNTNGNKKIINKNKNGETRNIKNSHGNIISPYFP